MSPQTDPVGQLRLIRTYFVEDTQHMIYDLPCALPWTIAHLSDSDEWVKKLHMVTRVRIFLATDPLTDLPYAGVVPFDEDEREHPIMIAVFEGALSVIAALNRLGFEPIIPDN